MKHFSGYGSYLLFMSLRTHFNQESYDFFKHKGKLRVTKESYIKRNDKYFFDKLAKMYDAEELKDFYIANILEDRHYVTDMADDRAHETFYTYTKRKQSLSYTFHNEIERLFCDGVSVAFRLNPNEYPRILDRALVREVGIDTLVILDDLLQFTPKYNKYLSGDIIWKKMDMRIRKFRPFLRYDKDRVKNLLKETIHENATGKSV